MTTFNEYQRRTGETAIFPKDKALEYLTLGLASEAGEVAGKVKKIFRDKGGLVTNEDRADLAAELGDVLWYVAQLADFLDYDLVEIAEGNLNKLKSRSARGVLIGSGDTR